MSAVSCTKWKLWTFWIDFQSWTLHLLVFEFDISCLKHEKWVFAVLDYQLLYKNNGW